MKALIYTLIFSLGLISCDNSYINKPNDLLSKSEMVDILTDLYINQQAINFTPTQDYSIKVAENFLYIFQEHNTTHKIFEDSYKYYYKKPTEYQKILDKVREKLTDKLSEEERKKLEQTEAQRIQVE